MSILGGRYTRVEVSVLRGAMVGEGRAVMTHTETLMLASSCIEWCWKRNYTGKGNIRDIVSGKPMMG